MVNLSVGTAALAALLGYAVVFFGIILLMAVIVIAGAAMNKNRKKGAEKQAESRSVVKADAKKLLSQFGDITYGDDVDKNHVTAILAAIMEMQEGRIPAVDLGSVTVPAGVDPKKIAAVMATIAEMEREA